MQSTILTATDFSPLGTLAVERAAAIANERRCRLQVVHARPVSVAEALRGLLRGLPGYDVEADAPERLRQLARELSGRHGVATIETGVVEGPASRVITARARDIDAGLVVLGAHGAGIVQELALGGTAFKVLQASHCPVLVVRRDPVSKYRNVVVGADFSATAARALAASRELLPDASHIVVHACSVAMEGRLRLAGADQAGIERYRRKELEVAESRMRDFVAAVRSGPAPDPQTEVRPGHPASVLVEAVRRHEANLLVVGRHGGSTLGERLLGSVTLNVLHHAPCDVLIVP